MARPGDSRAHPPPFLHKLGLCNPVTPQDVQQAYQAKLSGLSHSDLAMAEAAALEKAYQQALEYARFQTGRRGWLAGSIERYAQQEQLAGEINELGGEVALERMSWLVDEIGEDFAQVLDKIVGIRLTGAQVGDDEIGRLISRRAILASLHWLDLSNSQVTDYGIRRLSAFGHLRQLELNSTRITNPGLTVLASLPKLRKLGLAGTRLELMTAHRLRRQYPELEVVT